MQAFRPEIGLRGGGQKSPSDRRYMIYVINSARYELARQILADLHKGEQVFLVADECHHYASGENQLIFEFLPFLKEQEAQFFCMGLSATLPSESIKTMLSSFLGRCIYDYGIENALEAKTVCGYDVYHIEVPLSVHEKEEYEKLTDHMRLLYRKILKTKPYLKGRTQRELYEELCKIAGDKRFAIAKDAALYMKLSFKRKETVCLA